MRMTAKRQTTEYKDIHAILGEQLKEMLQLRAQVQSVHALFRHRDHGVSDLLGNISRDLSRLSEEIDTRAAASSQKATSVISTKPELVPKRGQDDSLESLLNQFCRYARKTSERVAAARHANDPETAALLDRTLSKANTSIWFLDVYSTAVCDQCRLSLPKWNDAGALRQIAS